MSSGMTGTQPHTTRQNDSSQVSVGGNPPQSEHPETRPHEHHLTPDRPPVAEASSGQGTGEHKAKRPRGFAAMDRKLVSEIARKGGKAAHSAGTAHEFTSEEARVAGRKGGRATHAKRRKGGEGEVAEATPREDDGGSD